MKEKDIISNIASRLAITELNAMQKRMASVKTGGNTITLLAPTGSGKTVAFAIALLKSLGPADGRIRAVVMAPSRELVLQIFDVIRPIATRLKTVAFYGGHSMQEEKNSLSVTPDIIIATPGRLLDHITRGLVDLSGVRTLVLDEYDKALELGFADEMKRVCKKLTSLSLIILTSATRLDELPPFLPVTQTSELIDFSSDCSPRRRMQIVNVPSPTRDKLDTLIDLLRSLDNGRVIVFANHRESVERIYSALRKAGLPAGIYHGGLEQNDRENAIEMLNNGSTPILVSTDLGARGLDIPELSAVVHYHLPPLARSMDPPQRPHSTPASLRRSLCHHLRRRKPARISRMGPRTGAARQKLRPNCLRYRHSIFQRRQKRENLARRHRRLHRSQRQP